MGEHREAVGFLALRSRAQNHLLAVVVLIDRMQGYLVAAAHHWCCLNYSGRKVILTVGSQVRVVGGLVQVVGRCLEALLI